MTCYVQQGQGEILPTMFHYNHVENATSTSTSCGGEVPQMFAGALPSKRSIAVLESSASTGIDTTGYVYQHCPPSPKKPRMMEIAPAAAVYETFVQSLEPIKSSVETTNASVAQHYQVEGSTTIPPNTIAIMPERNISNVVVEKTVITITAHKQDDQQQKINYVMPSVPEETNPMKKNAAAVLWMAPPPGLPSSKSLPTSRSLPPKTTLQSTSAPSNSAAPQLVTRPECDRRRRANSLALEGIISYWAQDIDNSFIKAFDDERHIFEMCNAQRKRSNSLEVKDAPKEWAQQADKESNFVNPFHDESQSNKMHQEFVNTGGLRKKRCRSNSLELTDVQSDWDQGHDFVNPFQDESHIPMFAVR